MSPKEIMVIIASVLLTVAAVAVGMVFFNNGKAPAGSALKQMTSQAEELSNSDIKSYDGLPITGDQVKYAITDKFSSKLGTTFTITVKTLADVTGKTYNAATSTLPALGADDYINPLGSFVGGLTYDTNKNISGIVFTQQK